MSISQSTPGPHPLAAFGARAHQVLDGLADAPAWSMTAEEQRTALLDLARLQARVAELRLRVLVAADRNDVAADSGDTSTVAWLAHRTRQDRSRAHADLRLAQALDSTCGATRDALAAGSLDLEQARTVVRAIDALPGEVGAGDRYRAERHLVDLARDHDAAALKVLGRRVFEVVDPAAADREEGRRLEAEERAAARSTYLHLHDNGDGTHSGRFKISDLHAAMLRKVLHAILAPGRRTDAGASAGGSAVGTSGAGTSEPDVRPAARARSAGPAARPWDAAATQDEPPPRVARPERMGQALCRLLERMPADRLPHAGGLSATVVVLMDHDKLVDGLGAAHLDTGGRISAQLARRLACEAGIVPAVFRKVLGGPSAVLDLGRRARFHTEPQRLALMVRDRGCTAEGCDRPPGWCEAHHDHVSWAEGGGTSVERGRLLCRFHHGKAHSPVYDMVRLADGKVRFHRRT